METNKKLLIGGGIVGAAAILGLILYRRRNTSTSANSEVSSGSINPGFLPPIFSMSPSSGGYSSGVSAGVSDPGGSFDTTGDALQSALTGSVTSSSEAIRSGQQTNDAAILAASIGASGGTGSIQYGAAGTTMTITPIAPLPTPAPTPAPVAPPKYSDAQIASAIREGMQATPGATLQQTIDKGIQTYGADLTPSQIQRLIAIRNGG